MDKRKKESLLEVKNLRIEFGKKKKDKFVAVDDVSFHIYKGETFGLVGESGSGKTTIGRAITRIVETAGGEIIFKGQKINGKISKELDKELTRKIQMIFQDPMASLNERAKVDYIVSEGLYNLKNYKDEEDRKRKVEKALLDVGLLPEFASRFPHEFSGGQRQRIGVARALIMEPEFIIADEPISALDVSIRAQVLNLLSELQGEKDLTYLFIAHDLSVVRFITDRLAVIHKGKIVEMAETEKLFMHPLHPYTQALLSAIPLPNPIREKEKVLEVYDPSCHNYEGNPPRWVEIESGHYILANDEEIEEYRKKLNKANGGINYGENSNCYRYYRPLETGNRLSYGSCR
ncbi:ATP-binding cassette domain-containing protein [Schnuerera ultunensis]|uniref:Oligopeptide ABC transporter (ATP-binding protein) n=1 Tax=[Clostridium] ultunense Esp TaxID=1288971 RepID=A0A1M4PQN2_9FIRM|nr:ABC transporter ATP-binding protein [Schnuerera ultunensis]SHD77797.1 oligopeptide ABC transporter (ATP-binding protein) [[Clostridium] ultunense Esp]